MAKEKTSAFMNEEEQVRVAAYHIWNDEGQPDGKAEEHWVRARQRLESEKAADAGAKPKAAKAKPARATKTAATKTAAGKPAAKKKPASRKSPKAQP